MKKYLFMGLILLLTGCQEANEIFGYDEYLYDEIIINEDGEERYYEGPVYINATSWGSMAYVSDKYVNKGIELLISETSDAEGGKVLEVNSNAISIDDLKANTQYHYCLYMPESGIKSRIRSVVVPDVSALSMEVTLEGDSLFCVIEDSISSSFILEKGFRIYYHYEFKHVVTDKKFAVSLPELKKEYGIEDNPFGFYCYAYVQTSNAYYRSPQMPFQWEGSSSSDPGTDDDSSRINTEDITISEITEETIDGVEYLKCTVTGYVDEVYFTQGWHDNYSQMQPDKVESNDEGTETTYYLKKGIYNEIRLKVFYKLYYNYEYGYYFDREKQSSYYTPKNYKVRTLDDFLAFAYFEGNYYYDENENEYYTTLTLCEDITLPSDMRLSLNWSRLTVEGNGHTIDGISYFPLFRTFNNVTIKNLKFGTDETVYEVKNGTCSYSTTSSNTPSYLLMENGHHSSYYGSYFEDCEIRGTIQVSGRDDFYITPDYYYYWSDEDKAAGTIDGYIVCVPGLKDYTKTEFK